MYHPLRAKGAWNRPERRYRQLADSANRLLAELVVADGMVFTLDSKVFRWDGVCRRRRRASGTVTLTPDGTTTACSAAASPWLTARSSPRPSPG